MLKNGLVIAGFFLIVIAIALGIVVKVRFFEDGSYWSSNTKQTRSDAVMRLEATGEDFRVYEFTPQKAPHMQCVFAAASQKGGLFCFPKVK